MPDYKSMYYTLASRVADAIDMLTKAQRCSEEKAMEEEQKSTANITHIPVSQELSDC